MQLFATTVPLIPLIPPPALPSEDKSSGGAGEVGRELPPERVRREGRRADAAPEPQREQRLGEAHPHHRGNDDVSALCERNTIDVLFRARYHVR